MMLGSFDIAPFIIVGCFIFSVAMITGWILWHAYHDEDPLEVLYGPPAFDDTPFVIEQLTTLGKETV